MSEQSPLVEKLSALTLKQALAGSVGLAFLYYLLMYNDGSSLEKAIKNTKQNIQTQQIELRKFEKAEEDAKRFKAALAEEGPKFESIIKYMPAELSEFEVMEILSSEVKAAGGRVKSTNATKVTSNSKDIYETIGVDLTLEITYSQLLLFLSYLTKTDKIVSLKEASINTNRQEVDGETLVSFFGHFEAYKYRSEVSSEQ
ncbi:MAG: type 4a pilus biogenesis protein PilO [Bdellovibrionales bacterium]|nr:type 4a pilus biogenesis protein PilO [Bdellovibrionales bacterium]